MTVGTLLESMKKSFGQKLPFASFCPLRDLIAVSSEKKGHKVQKYYKLALKTRGSSQSEAIDVLVNTYLGQRK